MPCYTVAFIALFTSLSSALPFSELGPRQPSASFDPEQQYVDTSGAHAFVAPTASDSRGGCPGLNALANHGYVSHNGTSNLVEIQELLPKVYGWGSDTAAFIALAAVIGAGKDGYHFEVGNWGKPYQSGFTPAHFKDLYGYGMISGADAVGEICQKYIAGNDGHAGDGDPDPLNSGMAEPLVDSLVFRCMANKSAEYPGGYLDGVAEQSFLAATSNGDGSFSHIYGHERIPDNFYTRNAHDPYSFAVVFADIATLAAMGCFNQPGGASLVGSLFYTDPLDLLGLTRGAYSNQDLDDDPTLQWCFMAQSLPFVLPLLVDALPQSSALNDALDTAMQGIKSALPTLDCKGHSIQSMDPTILASLPLFKGVQ